MFITELDVVNGCLATLGESGLTDMQEDHAYKATALQVLNEEHNRVLARGWWFNQERTYLYPDANSKMIYVPEDIYAVVVEAASGFSVTQMGRRMYDSRRRTYEWNNPLRVRLTRKFPFVDLPYVAAAAIRDAAILKFQSRIDADREVKEEVRMTSRLAWEELCREDSRNQKHNMLYRRGMSSNAIDAIGGRTGVHIPGPNILPQY